MRRDIVANLCVSDKTHSQLMVFVSFHIFYPSDFSIVYIVSRSALEKEKALIAIHQFQDLAGNVLLFNFWIYLLFLTNFTKIIRYQQDQVILNQLGNILMEF